MTLKDIILEFIEDNYPTEIGSDWERGCAYALNEIEKLIKESEEQGMSEQMEFPETFERFAEEYGFNDDKEVYTNGSELIPVFRVKQWLEQDAKLRAVETETAYECGKHANNWIPVRERLPEDREEVLVTARWHGTDQVMMGQYFDVGEGVWWCVPFNNTGKHIQRLSPTAWMPLPKRHEPKESEGMS